MNLIIVIELNGVQFWSDIIHVISKEFMLKCVPHVQHETVVLCRREDYKILSVSPLTTKEHPYNVKKKSARQFFHN